MLVGNRYKLGIRQRLALGRCACPEADVALLKTKEVASAHLAGHELWIDGFNVLTAVETALAGGYIFIGVDGCCRDIAGVHRRYHRVEETSPGIRLLGDCLASWGVNKAVWWLDSPVANSGRLKAILQQTASEAGWNWEVELVLNPDRVLAKTGEIVATADRMILKRCQRWFNFGWAVIQGNIPQARVIDCSGIKKD